MEKAISEIKRKIDIISFIGGLIPIKKAGRNYKANCPFHHEKTPSFVISPDRQIWHCFGACQDGGDVIKFVMRWENITFIEAVHDLAEKNGITIEMSGFEDQAWKKKERLLEINRLASEFFSYIFHKTPFGKKARTYVSERGIDEKITKIFHLGYAPSSWDSLLQFLKRKKFSDREILDAGLAVAGQSGRIYDRFRGRIMFPIGDSRGQVIGFSGRMLDGSSEAKYINTPETPLYHKRETLYGLHLAKNAAKDEENMYLVEGEFDVISPHKLGVTNVVAIKGSAVTKEQLMLLKRYTKRITLMLDSDPAGMEAAKRGIEEAENQEFEIGIVMFNFAKDPDEAIQKDAIQFKKTIQKHIPLYDFIIDYAFKKNPQDDSYAKKRIPDEVVGYLEKIRNPIVSSHYTKKLAVLLDVSEASIESLIRKNRFSRKKMKFVSSSKKHHPDEMREILLQRYLLSYIFQHENPKKMADSVFQILSIDDFSIPSYKKLCEHFLDFVRKQPDVFSTERFLQILPQELRSVFDE